MPFPHCLGCASVAAALFSLVSVAAPPEPMFRTLNVDTNIAIGYGLALADVDGDRRTDILLCDKSQIAWYRNPTWQKHVIAEKLTALDHVCIAAADVDGDGKAEIAVGAGWNPGDTLNSGALFILQPPVDRRTAWTPVPLPHDPTIHRIRWVRNHQGRLTLVSAPLHGRGNNPGTGEGDGVRIQRYTPAATTHGPWPIEVLDASHHKTHNLDPIQWDEDPAEELLLGSREGAFLIDPGADGSSITRQLGSAENGGFGEIRAGRLPNSRFVAGISPMHGNQVVVLTPPANPGELWNRRVLDEGLIDGHALACADFLGLGTDQIAVGWRAMNRPGAKVGVKIFTPLDPQGSEWRETLIDDNGMACEDLQVADLNGDGRPDIVAAGRGTRNLRIYFNESRR
jgi:FG-GAP-like repeat